MATRISARKPRPAKAATSPKIDRRAALERVMELMAIPGTSGFEGAVAQYVVDQFRAVGVPASAFKRDQAHKKTPIAGEVGNLVLQLPGTVRGPRRLLMAHMDTVPVCVGSRPKRSARMIHSADPRTGLGADDRAGVAVVLETALAILRNKLPHPPLTFLWLIQEEVGLQGARCLKTGMLGAPKLAFNFDGGDAAKLCVAATGGDRLQIEIEGLASHAGGAPEQGISAIAIASLAIAQLVREGWHGLIEKGGRTGTSNVGVIEGGKATNVVTDHVTLRAEARSHDPVFRKQIVSVIERAFRDAVKDVRNSAGRHGRVTVEKRTDYEAFRLADNEPCVLAAERAARALGLDPIRAISNGGLDANWMFAHGIPTVTLGCGQRNIHTVSEQLDLDQFDNACRIALHLATETE